MKKNKSFLWLSLFIFTIFLSKTWGINPTTLHLTIMEIKKAKEPYEIEDLVVFTYESKNKHDYVAARFEHENYVNLHVYRINQYGVYFLIFPAPAHVKTLKYRIVTDGIWMSDPRNPHSFTDNGGIDFSLYNIRQSYSAPTSNPELQNGRAHFRLELPPGKAVYIAGDFNNWDPYMFRLIEESPGIYSINFKVTQGRHYYYFLVNGKKQLDPHNSMIIRDREKQNLSSFYVE